MKVLFDTNVVLDLLLDREPFSTLAAQLFSRVEGGEVEGSICATTVTTVHYLARKAVGNRQARGEVQKLLDLFEVAPVDRTVLEGALTSKFADFEDAVLHQAALNAGVQGIVTRNIQDFKGAKIPVYSPEELARLLQVRDGAGSDQDQDDIKRSKRESEEG